jgi:hypothetical protein
VRVWALATELHEPAGPEIVEVRGGGWGVRGVGKDDE